MIKRSKILKTINYIVDSRRPYNTPLDHPKENEILDGILDLCEDPTWRLFERCVYSIDENLSSSTERRYKPHRSYLWDDFTLSENQFQKQVEDRYCELVEQAEGFNKQRIDNLNIPKNMDSLQTCSGNI